MRDTNNKSTSIPHKYDGVTDYDYHNIDGLIAYPFPLLIWPSAKMESNDTDWSRQSNETEQIRTVIETYLSAVDMKFQNDSKLPLNVWNDVKLSRCVHTEPLQLN